MNATAQRGVKRTATRPLSDTFRSELEQASVLKIQNLCYIPTSVRCLCVNGSSSSREKWKKIFVPNRDRSRIFVRGGGGILTTKLENKKKVFHTVWGGHGLLPPPLNPPLLPNVRDLTIMINL